MSISLSKYVDITSGVGAGAAVPTRDLIGRFFTTNPLVPVGGNLEFGSADEVLTYFGAASEEYARAAFYFGWVSKNITRAQKISFSRWAATAVGSTIYGKVANYAVSSFTSVTTGDFSLTLGGFTYSMTAISFSGNTTLADCAADVQTKIRAQTGGGVAWTGATVTYDATRKSFNLVSGATGDDTIAVAAGTITNILPLLGWDTGAILSNGSNAQTVTEVLSNSASASNNFGSFAFVDTLTQDQIVEAATWNDTQNVQFIYSVPCTSANYAALVAALADIGGVTLTLAPLAAEFPEQCPMMILAATDYTQRNAVQNYQFQQFTLTPSVTTDADYELYSGVDVNFYGQTQTAGTQIAFYQRGVMQGLPVDPLDQNTYSNEIWLKDAAGAAIMTLLLAVPRVPANSSGRAQLLSIIQSVIDQALFNGTISVGRTLTSTQKLYINELTGNTNAWRQVQNLGWWLDVVITPYVESGTTKYKAVYTLIYAKDDVIRKVEGRDILI